MRNRNDRHRAKLKLIRTNSICKNWSDKKIKTDKKRIESSY